MLVSKVMDSIPGVDEELYNFLGHQLLPFLLDRIASTGNINNAARPTHLTEKDLDNLFLSAFKEYDGADSPIRDLFKQKCFQSDNANFGKQQRPLSF